MNSHDFTKRKLHELVNEGLNILRPLLTDYILDRLQVHYAQDELWKKGIDKSGIRFNPTAKTEARTGSNDPADWIRKLCEDTANPPKILLYHPEGARIFEIKKNTAVFNALHMVVSARNLVRHDKDVSRDDAEAALEAMVRLLIHIGKDNEIPRIKALLKELRGEKREEADGQGPDKEDNEEEVNESKQKETGSEAGAEHPAGKRLTFFATNAQYIIPASILLIIVTIAILLPTGHGPQKAQGSIVATVLTDKQGGCVIHTTVETVIYDVLLKRDLQVIRASAGAQAFSPELLCNAAFGDQAAMENLITQVQGTRFLIIAAVRTEYLGQEHQLHSTRVELNLRAVDVESWEVVASRLFTTTEADISGDAARDKGLRLLGEQAGEYLAEKIGAYKKL